MRRTLVLVVWAAWCCTVGAAGMLALVRWGDPSRRRLIELVALAPLGLPLAAMGVVAAVVLLVASRRLRLPGLALTAALVLGGVHAWQIIPLYVGSDSGAQRGPLVVMSLNVEFGDASAVARATRDHDVDVLVLLEVTRQRLDQLRATGITRWLPYTAGVEDEQVMGTIVLSRVPITTSALLYAGADSLLVGLDTPALGRLQIVGVHTRPPYDPEGWLGDLSRIKTELTRLRADDEAVILAGDFNATLGHAPMRRILDLGFRDAADQTGGGWSPTWPSGGHERCLGLTVPAFAAIDHILTAPGLVVTGAETVTVDGADHRAILASVSRTGS